MEDSTIQRAQMGDQLAFQQLIEVYQLIVWRTVQVLLPDQADVEDVMQEVWLDVWRGLPNFQPERPLRPWLLTIAANRCHMLTRRRRGPTQALDTPEAEQLLAIDNVLEDVLRLEKDLELHVALKSLPIEQRQILELRFFADLDLNEIALIMGIPLGTVKSRLHRALNYLRKQLSSMQEAYKEINL